MIFPEETVRLMTLYNSLTKEEFRKLIKTDKQAKADLEVTAKWLEAELQPFVDICKETIKNFTKAVEPIVTYALNNKESFNAMNKSLTNTNGFNLGA